MPDESFKNSKSQILSSNKLKAKAAKIVRKNLKLEDF